MISEHQSNNSIISTYQTNIIILNNNTEYALFCKIICCKIWVIVKFEDELQHLQKQDENSK